MSNLIINADKKILLLTQTVAGARGAASTVPGPPGIDGIIGVDGKSAYELAVDNGFVGTEQQWLDSLHGGAKGDTGATGASAYEVAVANGFVGNEAAWLLSLEGTHGTNGIDGLDGVDGASAYAVAVANGFVGDEATWLASLKGIAGNDGLDSTVPGPAGLMGRDGIGIPGEDGDNYGYWPIPGAAGKDGIIGQDGVIGRDGMGIPGQDGEESYYWPIPGERGPGNNKAEIVEVAKSGGQFTSVASAVSYIVSLGDCTSAKPYVVMVAPGIYEEDPFTMIPYLSIVGRGGFYNTVLNTTNKVSSDFITGSNSSEIINIGISGPHQNFKGAYKTTTGYVLNDVVSTVTGSLFIALQASSNQPLIESAYWTSFDAAAKYAAVKLPNQLSSGTTPFKLVNCAIIDGFYGIYTDAATKRSVIHCINVVNFNKNNYGMYSFMRCEGYGNITCLTSGYMAGSGNKCYQGFYCKGPSSEMTLDACFFRNGGGVADGSFSNTALVMDDGAIVRATAFTASAGHNGVKILGTGVGSDLRMLSSVLSDDLTGLHIDTGNSGPLYINHVEFTGKSDNLRIDIDTDDVFVANFSDVATVGEEGTRVMGELWLGNQANSIPLRKYGLGTYSTGWNSGGSVSKGAGVLEINVLAGDGFINTGNSVVNKIWSELTLTVADNTEMQYCYVNVSGIQTSAIEPSYSDAILLAVFDTKDGEVTFIADHRIPIAQGIASIANYLEEVVGPVSVGTGGTVTEHDAGNTVELKVETGEYFLIPKPVVYTGGDPVTVHVLYGDGTGAFKHDLDIYQAATHFPYVDAGLGVLSAPVSGKFYRHLLFVVKHPIGEWHHLIAGTEAFETQGAAEVGNNPLAPLSHMTYGLRLAAIIMDSSGHIVSIKDQKPRLGQSAGGSASITVHNLMTGKQGGTTGEFYHLTSAQYTDLHTKGYDQGLDYGGTYSVTAQAIVEFMNTPLGLVEIPTIVHENVTGNISTPSAALDTHLRAYVLDTGAISGKFSAFAVGDLVEYQVDTWVLIKSLVAGDRLGIAFVAGTGVGQFIGKENQIATVVGTAGSYTYTYEPPINNWAAFVTSATGYYSQATFVYSELALSWIQFSQAVNYKAGTGISINGRIISLNATTADIPDSTDKRYVTDKNLVAISKIDSLTQGVGAFMMLNTGGDDGTDGVPGIQGKDGAASTVPGPQGIAGREGIGVPGLDGDSDNYWPIPGDKGAASVVAGPQGIAGSPAPVVPGQDGEDADYWPIPGERGAASVVAGPSGSNGIDGHDGLGVPGQDAEEYNYWPIPGDKGAASTVQGPAGTNGIDGHDGLGVPGQDGEDADYWPIPGEKGADGIYVEPVIDTYTFAQFMALIASYSLVAEKEYRISDYSLTYTMPGTSIPYVSPAEPLIVRARSTVSIYGRARSESYPNDIIYYTLKTTSILLDNNVVDTNGSLKGHIYYREDPVKNNKFGEDFRNVTYRRWNTTAAPTVYNQVTDVNSTGSFKNFPMFAEATGASNVYGNANSSISNNTFLANYNNTGLLGTRTNTLCNSVFVGATSVTVQNNTFESGFLSNTFGEYTLDNLVSYFFADNISNGSFVSNDVGFECRGNIFNYSFTGNKVCGGFVYNTFDYSASYNLFDNNFFSNVFHNECNQNNFNGNINSNTFNNLCSDNFFSTYSIYNCTFPNTVKYNKFYDTKLNYTYSSTPDYTVHGIEKSLENPSVDGYVLTSTTTGVRSWVAAGGAGSPGAAGKDGIGIPGLDGDSDNYWPIPGDKGSQGADGGMSYTQIVALGMDGSDGDDVWPMPGGKGDKGDTTQQTIMLGLDGVDGEDMYWPVPGPQGAGGTGPAGASGPATPGVPGQDAEEYNYWPIPGEKGPQGAAGGTGAAGADKQIQFNDGGTVLGGDADFTWNKTTNTLGLNGADTGLEFTAITNEPGAQSAGIIRTYAKTIAGRTVPKFVGPAGVDNIFQAHIGFNGFKQVAPATGTSATTCMAALATAFTNTATTIVQVAVTNTSIKTYMRSVTLASSTTAGNVASHFTPQAEVCGTGGYFFMSRFYLSGTIQTGQRGFHGLAARTSIFSNVDPTTEFATAKVGLGYNAATGNWKLVASTTSAAMSAVDLGASFPLNNTDVMELVLYCPPGAATTIYYRVTNLTTAATTSGSITGNIPAASAALGVHHFACNNATAAASTFGLNKWCLESDY